MYWLERILESDGGEGSPSLALLSHLSTPVAGFQRHHESTGCTA